jgi:ubiquinone/menaquinone biosynthesis C-methylase UbiE
MTLAGRSHTDEHRAHWMRAWAVPLPFAENTFDLVVSLEVLEFTPHPAHTLDELHRVVRPGGWLLITNRVGRDSKWIFGKIIKRDQFESVLKSHGFREIEVFPWQVEYDLTWARKPG